MFASDDFYTGTPRVPIVLFNGPEVANNVQSVAVTLYDISEEEARPIWNGTASAYDDAPYPYWTIHPEIPSAGIWGLEIETTTADGLSEKYQRSIEVNDQPVSPAVGSQPPASQNRTTPQYPVDQLTSGNQPDPALYDMTVADALQSGKPTVVIFATPAFCQTRICTPVVSVAEAVQAKNGENVNVIHLEIYDDFQNLTNAPEVAQWGLTSEPWTFVIDADGVVSARLGGPISEREVTEALEQLQ